MTANMKDSLYGLIPYAYNGRTEMGFTNFQWVVPGKVARSSQPGYNNASDTVQSFSMVQIMFLKTKGIRCIISANELGITPQSQRLLDSAHIAYHHFSVVDRQPPTAYHLQNASDRIDQTLASGGGVLVYCGYGQGRTGTFVAGWAMLKWLAADDGKRQLTRNQMCTEPFLRNNFGVEHGPQVAAVRAAAALPALPMAAPTGVANFGGSAGSGWIPPLPPSPIPFFNSGASALGMPNMGTTTLNFANFGGGSGSSDDIF